MDIDMQCLG